MELDLSKVEFSHNDKRLGIKVPTELTEDLAYFMGVHVGDGYMKIQKRKSAIDYKLQYSGHFINEYAWYQFILSPLINKLFNKENYLKKSNSNSVSICFRSKAILTFMHHACGIQLSPKKNIDVPEIIKNANLSIKAAFIRGLVDTEGSLVFKNSGRNPTIDISTSSKALYDTLQELISELGIGFYSCVYHTSRNLTPIIQYKIQINGKKKLAKWIELVGFSSYNHLTKYLVWKTTGSLKPYTNIHERIEILEKKKRPGGDLNS